MRHHVASANHGESNVILFTLTEAVFRETQLGRGGRHGERNRCV